MDNISSSNESTNALNIRTKTDSQLESTERLYEAANRVDNIITELGSNANIFEDQEASKRTKYDAARGIRKSIIPALEKVGSILKDAAKSLAPIGSVKYISDRNERKTSAQRDPARPKPPKKPRSCTIKSSKSISLPPPKNGIEYTKLEACEVVVKTNGKQSDILKEMMERKYISCGKATFYRILKHYKEGGLIIDTEWSIKGRPRLIPESNLDAVVNELKQDGGRSYDTLNSDRKISRSSIRNYKAEIAMKPEWSLTHTSIEKTNTRFAAENSFRAPINNAMLIAATHFVEVNQEDLSIRNEMKEVLPETCELYDLVTDARGPVVPIQPDLITSTDDTTVLIFEGSTSKRDQFCLVTKESCLNRGTNAVYNVDESNHMNGMRVKLMALQYQTN